MGGENIADILFIISNVSFGIAAVAFITAVVLFIKFKIPSVIGDLSGKNARRSIEQMRSYNEKTGDKKYRPSKVNEQRGKITAPMPVGKGKGDDERPDTGLLNESENMKETMPLTDETESLVEETAKLDDETMALGDRTALSGQKNMTERLNQIPEATMPLRQREPIQLLEEILLIHTDEVI